MIELALAVGAVIVVSALCSLFEAVLYSVPVSYIETLNQEGRASGRILTDLRLRGVDRPISAILSLNTIANTGGAFIAGAAFLKVFGDEWSIYFTISFTLAVLIFSEIIPKTIGVVFSRALASTVAYPLQILVWVLAPLVRLCRVVTGVFSQENASEQISEQEILVMAHLGQRTGAINPDEARIVENILSLKRRAVRDVMTPRNVVFALGADLTIEEAHQKAGIWSYSRVPVYEKDFEEVVGVVLRRDALNALTEGRGDIRISELMHPVHFVAETFALDRVLRTFLERRVHLFPVVDEYGGLAGVITLEDVLEEILGREIVDEFDTVTDMRELARQRRRDVLEGE